MPNSPIERCAIKAARLEAAPINDLQGVVLENGANRLSPGSTLVDQALARLPGQRVRVERRSNAFQFFKNNAKGI